MIKSQPLLLERNGLVPDSQTPFAFPGKLEKNLHSPLFASTQACSLERQIPQWLRCCNESQYLHLRPDSTFTSWVNLGDLFNFCALFFFFSS